MGAGKFQALDEVVLLLHLQPCHRVVLHGVEIAVDVALPGADVVRNRHRRGDFKLSDARAEVDLGDADALFDHLVCEAALQVEVILLLDVLKGFGRDQRCDAELRVALGQGRVCVVEADGGDVVVRLGDVRVVFPDLVGVHRGAGEGGIVRDAVLFGGALNEHDDRHGDDRELAVVDHADGAFGNLAERLDHLGVDAVGVRAGDDVVAVNLVAARGAHAVDLAVLHQDLRDFLVELVLRAVLFAFGLQLHAHLMAEAAADIAAGEVVGHQEGVDGEGQVVHAVADVDPVRGQHLDGLLRQIEGVDDFGGGVADGLYKVRMLHQHLHLAHRRDGEDVHAVVHAAAQQHQLVHLVVGARADLVDLFRDGGVAVVIVRVQHLVDAGVGQRDAVAFGHGQPVDVHAHVVKELADLQALAGLADGHHLVQGGLNFKAVADKVGGQAAGHVVLFQDQDVLDAPGLQLQARRHAGQRAADDNDVVMVFIKFHAVFLSKRGRLCEPAPVL